MLIFVENFGIAIFPKGIIKPLFDNKTEYGELLYSISTALSR